MMEVALMTSTVQVGGKTLNYSNRVEASGVGGQAVTIPAASSSALTTRTNDTSGTLTVVGDHDFDDDMVVDLYWAGGSRRGAVVGVVAGAAVPFSGGVGDNLPVESTVVRLSVQSRYNDGFGVGECVFLSLQSSGECIVSLLEEDSGLKESQAFRLPQPLENSPGSGFVWLKGAGVPADFEADAIVAIGVSNGTLAPVSVEVKFLYDSSL